MQCVQSKFNYIDKKRLTLASTGTRKYRSFNKTFGSCCLYCAVMPSSWQGQTSFRSFCQFIKQNKQCG